MPLRRKKQRTWIARGDTTPRRELRWPNGLSGTLWVRAVAFPPLQLQSASPEVPHILIPAGITGLQSAAPAG
jgi:hypothetical protein